LYYFTGNLINGGVNLTGTGVTIYMSGSSQFNMNSASTMTLTAPTAAQIAADTNNIYNGCTSCAGMLIWEANGDPSAMNLDSGSNSSWGGAIYQPSAQLTLNGNSNSVAYGGEVDAQSVMANSSLQLGCGGGTTNGSLTVALAE
jgi:hypothetical protein